MQLYASLTLVAGLLVAWIPSQPPATPLLSRPVSSSNAPATSSQSAPGYRMFFDEEVSSFPRVPGPMTFPRKSKPSSEEAKLNATIRQAIQDLTSAEPSTKATTENALRKLLNELFDLRSGSREKQIADLESRLKKLREQLDERNSRKDEIVDLRVQTIVNDANGLTF